MFFMFSVFRKCLFLFLNLSYSSFIILPFSFSLYLSFFPFFLSPLFGFLSFIHPEILSFFFLTSFSFISICPTASTAVPEAKTVGFLTPKFPRVYRPVPIQTTLPRNNVQLCHTVLKEATSLIG